MDHTVYKQAIHDNGYLTKTDIEGNITFVNDNFCKISGYSKDELIGKKHSIIKSYNIKQNLFEDMWKTILDGKRWNGIVENIAKDGTPFYMDTNIYPVKNEKGEIVEFIAFRNNLTHYIHLLNFDTLTGLKNRDSLKNEIETDKTYILTVVNIDNFSEINEFYGGFIGDKIIIECAKRLKNIFSGSSVFRLHGDEFAILKQLPFKYKKEEISNIVKNKLKSIFERSFYIDEIELPVTATSGSYIGQQNILRNANIAYKNAKSKNISFSTYDDDMLLRFANFSNNKRVAFDIKEAIKDDKVIPYYQPIIDNRTGKIVKYEALARLVKESELIMPKAFINISKKIKYYSKITRAMIQKSFENFSCFDNLGFSVNLTVEDIANVRTFNFIVEKLSNNKNNHNVTFELVESDGIDDFELFNKFVDVVKQFGAKISIDDFGTGYSNFSYLAKIEPDFLKIDGSLIKNIENYKDFDVVKTMVDFAKMYNIKTIAEFVENEEILVLIKELGIDYSQGYHFGKPISFDEVKSVNLF